MIIADLLFMQNEAMAQQSTGSFTRTTTRTASKSSTA